MSLVGLEIEKLKSDKLSHFSAGLSDDNPLGKRLNNDKIVEKSEPAMEWRILQLLEIMNCSGLRGYGARSYLGCIATRRVLVERGNIFVSNSQVGAYHYNSDLLDV